MSSGQQTGLELYLGKGGTGKTTLAATAALCYASAGVRSLVISMDASRALSDILGVRLAADTGKSVAPVPVRPGMDALAIDSAALLEQRYQALAPLLGGHDHELGITLPEPSELVGLPVAEELLAWHEVGKHAASGQWDVIVIDCGPTAELLRSLRAPDLVHAYLERMWPARRRATAQGMRAAVLAAAAGEVAAAATTVRALLTSDRTRARLVAAAELAGVGESARLCSAAALFGVRVDTLILNRLLPAPETGPHQQWHERRIAAQMRAIKQLEQALPALHGCYLGDCWSEPVGLAGLAELAEDFAHAVMPRLRLRAEPYGVPAVDGSTDTPWQAWPETGFPAVRTIRMYLPVADPTTLRLGRAEDDLIVGADGMRRRVPLPPGLAGAAVVNAELDGHYLIVRLQMAENLSG